MGLMVKVRCPLFRTNVPIDALCPWLLLNFFTLGVGLHLGVGFLPLGVGVLPQGVDVLGFGWSIGVRMPKVRWAMTTTPL